MKTGLILLLLLLFSFAGPGAVAGTENEPGLQITSKGVLSPWQAGKTQNFSMDVVLPKKFHLYKDQLRVLNIKPEGFTAGQIEIHPEVSFFDKFSGKNRKGLFEGGGITVQIEPPPEKNLNARQVVTLTLRYQICSEKVCYLPKTTEVQVTTVQQANFSSTAEPSSSDTSEKESFSPAKWLEDSLKSSLLLAFISVFFAGVLTSFTPCIFPMLPITVSILGHQAEKDRLHNFSRSLSYVLGIALTYSSLGVVAALTGSLFGSALTNKYVLSFLVLLFFAMALSMWGVFEIQSPAFIRNRLGTGKSHGLGGAFLMGLVAGVVASPCVGPVLVSILSYVSTTKNALLGFALLFTFAMGLGLIFIVIGLFSSALKFLPRSGKWMDIVKFILGACMWGAALYYAQFLFSDRWWTALLAVSAIALSIWKGAFHFRKKNHIRQSFLLALFIFSTSVLVVCLFTPQYLSGAFHLTETEVPANTLNWTAYSDQALSQAQKDGRPVMIDFHADWCGACHELDEKTFSTDTFKELGSSFSLVKFDATEDTPAVQAILKKYDVKGLPTVIFINRNGVLLKALTFTQFLDINELKPKMQEALK